MVLVTGVNGQLGYDVVKVLNERNIPCKGIDIDDLDITNEQDVSDYIANLKPTAVIHCAAYTAVDKAEDDIETCTAVNVNGPKYIATACKKLGAKMIQVSTDYVLPGDGEECYEVDAKTGAKSVYGKTKCEGEEVVREILDNCFIARVSWTFGINGNNFVKTMLRLGAEKEELNVVDDQIGSPTYTKDIAVTLCDMIETEKYGTYHVTNEGFCSWAQFAAAIMEKAGLNCKINPIPSSAYPTKATRPLNSRLSKKALDENGFKRLPTWESGLERFLEEVRN